MYVGDLVEKWNRAGRTRINFDTFPSVTPPDVR